MLSIIVFILILYPIPRKVLFYSAVIIIFSVVIVFRFLSGSIISSDLNEPIYLHPVLEFLLLWSNS